MLRPKAIKVETKPNYHLLVTFHTSEQRIFDVRPYLSHVAYRELRDERIFQTVRPAGLSIEWVHGQDICPDDLYYNSIPFDSSEEFA